MSPAGSFPDPAPEVDPEELRKYNDKAIRLARQLPIGKPHRWATLVNAAAAMAEIDPGDDESGQS